jgi:hypothetical protein
VPKVCLTPSFGQEARCSCGSELREIPQHFFHDLNFFFSDFDRTKNKMKKKRGHGWARPKGYNKKCSRHLLAKKSVSDAKKNITTFHSNQQQQEFVESKRKKPSLTARKTTFTEDWKALVRHRYPERFVHSNACHFHDDHRGCRGCWENWKMDVYAKMLKK